MAGQMGYCTIIVEYTDADVMIQMYREVQIIKMKEQTEVCLCVCVFFLHTVWSVSVGSTIVFSIVFITSFHSSFRTLFRTVFSQIFANSDKLVHKNTQSVNSLERNTSEISISISITCPRKKKKARKLFDVLIKRESIVLGIISTSAKIKYCRTEQKQRITGKEC